MAVELLVSDQVPSQPKPEVDQVNTEGDTLKPYGGHVVVSRDGPSYRRYRFGPGMTSAALVEMGARTKNDRPASLYRVLKPLKNLRFSAD
jgi:hypothetical protein